MFACSASLLTLAACGDDDDDTGTPTKGASGAGGAGGAAGKAGAGGSGGASFSTCADAFESCVNDDTCNKALTCIGGCVREGIDAINAANTCLAAVGKSLQTLPQAQKLFQCQLGICTGCATPTGGSGAGGAGAGGAGAGGAGAAGAGAAGAGAAGAAAGAGGASGGAGGASGGAGGASGGAGGASGGAGGAAGGGSCPDVSKADITQCVNGMGSTACFTCFCAN